MVENQVNSFFFFFLVKSCLSCRVGLESTARDPSCCLFAGSCSLVAIKPACPPVIVPWRCVGTTCGPSLHVDVRNSVSLLPTAQSSADYVSSLRHAHFCLWRNSLQLNASLHACVSFHFPCVCVCVRVLGLCSPLKLTVSRCTRVSRTKDQHTGVLTNPEQQLFIRRDLHSFPAVTLCYRPAWLSSPLARCRTLALAYSDAMRLTGEMPFFEGIWYLTEV